MDLFTIAQMQQFSGIKAHTIRIWEQRYNALTPSRSEGNTRYYDNEQLRRLLNIVTLLEAETKISVANACRMSNQELFETVEERLLKTNATNEVYAHFVTQLLAAGLRFDEDEFTTIFNQALQKFGLQKAYTNMIYPLLNRVGLMWSTNTMPPAHEHFISNLIRQKIISATESLPLPADKNDTWLLFLPEDEFHEIGLLMAQFILREAGKKAIYIGANVPKETLKLAVENIHPSHLMFFFVHHNLAENGQEYLDFLTKEFTSKKILFAGTSKLTSQLKLAKNTTLINSFDTLSEALA